MPFSNEATSSIVGLLRSEVIDDSGIDEKAEMARASTSVAMLEVVAGVRVAVTKDQVKVFRRGNAPTKARSPQGEMKMSPAIFTMAREVAQ